MVEKSKALNAERFKSIFHPKHSEFINIANIKAKVNTVKWRFLSSFHFNYKVA